MNEITLSLLERKVKKSSFDFSKNKDILKLKINTNKINAKSRKSKQKPKTIKPQTNLCNSDYIKSSASLWTLISKYFPPINEKELFGKVLVPQAYRGIFGPKIINYPDKKDKNTQLEIFKAKRPSYISILTSSLVFVNNTEKNSVNKVIEIETPERDLDWMTLDFETRMKYELESIGLGNGDFDIISNDLANEIEKSNYDVFIAASESNLVKEEITKKILKKKAEVKHYNFICNCVYDTNDSK